MRSSAVREPESARKGEPPRGHQPQDAGSVELAADGEGRRRRGRTAERGHGERSEGQPRADTAGSHQDTADQRTVSQCSEARADGKNGQRSGGARAADEMQSEESQPDGRQGENRGERDEQEPAPGGKRDATGDGKRERGRVERAIEGELEGDCAGRGARSGDCQRGREAAEQTKMPRIVEQDASL